MKTISATEARVEFGRVMRQANEDGTQFVVEKAGKPLVVILAFEAWRRMAREAEDRPFDRVLLETQDIFDHLQTVVDLPDAAEVVRAGRDDLEARVTDA